MTEVKRSGAPVRSTVASGDPDGSPAEVGKPAGGAVASGDPDGSPAEGAGSKDRSEDQFEEAKGEARVISAGPSAEAQAALQEEAERRGAPVAQNPVAARAKFSKT